MNLYPVSVFLLLFINTWIVGHGSSPSHFTTDVSINCGSTATSATRDGREWYGDMQPELSNFLQMKGSSTSSTAVSGDDPLPPYSTARLSRSQFSYVLRVSPGQKILRLHFNPTPYYKGYKRFKDLFAVDAGSFTLLSNFSASLTARALGVNSFVKEYCICIQENQLFNIVFSPASSRLSDTLALINGIEIISLPAGLSYFHGASIGLPVVGKSPFYVDNSTALEMIRRLNLKQDSVSSAGDGGYMFGMWEATPKQKASKVKNFTWATSVDVGFSYLVRLYFSKVPLKMGDSGAFVFKVSINEMLVDTGSSVFRERENEDSFIPMYVDYMVMMRGHKQEARRDLVISIESNVEFIDGHGSFKGFEIAKLSNFEYSLASPNPLSSAQDSPYGALQTMHNVVGGKNMIATFTIIFLALANIIIYTLSKIRGADATGTTKEKTLLSARAQHLCRRFSLAEIQSATRNFSEAYVIGKGGFGKVYKGLIDEGQETVAIKRLRSNSRQGAREFCTEIETLIELRHVNLVSLVGYCNEHEEMIIVYEYLANGTLSDHLYKLARKNGNCPPLNWKERLSVCIGAARGLEYLHSGKLLIHRDIKASNILLDEHFLAKISDFGLAKSLNRSKPESHASTKVKGTLGYLDPNYYSTGKLTRKSDIYALGVVLLEALCGRPAVDRSTMYDEQILTKWALENINKGRLHQIVDLNMRGEILEDSLKSFVELAKRCLLDEPKKRPRMAQVVLQLEFALEQQERETSHLPKNEITSDLYPIHPYDEAGKDGKFTAEQRNMEEAINNEGKTIDGVRKGTGNEIHPANDEMILSASTGQAMTDVQNVAPPNEGQTNSKLLISELPSARKGGRKSATNKLSLFTSWDAFWNRVRPSNKIKPSSSGDHVVETVQESKQNVDMHLINVPAIPLDEMKKLTGNFSSRCVIGNGHRGTVFRAVLESGQAAAIKTLEYIEQNEEFALVSVLSNLKHENVVQLLGYCMDDKGKQVILAYEFAPHGSLDDILHGESSLGLRPVLSWTQRVKISIEAAKGLEYVHEKAQMHRNIKSSNILLFGDYDAAKITDFRQSRPGSDVTECFSAMAGTLGYQAPEYVVMGELSWRSDVYNFGVVLMELLTGRRPFDRSLPRPEQNLVRWVTSNVEKDKVKKVVDARLEGKYPIKAAAKMADVAALCVQYEPDFRPRMSVVVKALQSLLGG